MAIIRVGEDLVDDETGEYAGPADNDLRDGIQSEDDLLWYMRRRMEYQSAFKARQRELEAVVENCKQILAKQERRMAWFNGKYEAEAAVLAETLLPRKADGSYRAKTHDTPFGKISRRTTKASISIANPEAALEYCKEFHPDAVKVSESVLVSKLPEDVIESYVAIESAPPGFEFKPERESVTFTTV